MKYPKKKFKDYNITASTSKVEIIPYGFIWDDDLTVERICNNNTSPKFKVLRVYTENGDCVEILSRPRSTVVTTIKKKERIK